MKEKLKTNVDTSDLLIESRLMFTNPNSLGDNRPMNASRLNTDADYFREARLSGVGSKLA
jgi:hypothetical protein